MQWIFFHFYIYLNLALVFFSVDIVGGEEGVKCYACTPNGREVGTPRKGQAETDESNLYQKGNCEDWHKADATTKKSFRFTKMCVQGCLYGSSETKYSVTASENEVVIESKLLNLYGKFMGCFGNGNDQGTPLKMGGCVEIQATDEEGQTLVHPLNRDIVIRTKGLEGTHHICGCDKDFCNRGSRVVFPSFLWGLVFILMSHYFMHGH